MALDTSLICLIAIFLAMGTECMYLWDGMVFCDIISFVLFFCFFSCVYAYADVL